MYTNKLAEGCDSCGAEVLYEMLEKMEYYMQIYNDTESGREPVEQVTDFADFLHLNLRIFTVNKEEKIKLNVSITKTKTKIS